MTRRPPAFPISAHQSPLVTGNRLDAALHREIGLRAALRQPSRSSSSQVIRLSASLRRPRRFYTTSISAVVDHPITRVHIAVPTMIAQPISVGKLARRDRASRSIKATSSHWDCVIFVRHCQINMVFRFASGRGFSLPARFVFCRRFSMYE